jgi:hypothetical protein
MTSSCRMRGGSLVSRRGSRPARGAVGPCLLDVGNCGHLGRPPTVPAPLRCRPAARFAVGTLWGMRRSTTPAKAPHRMPGSPLSKLRKLLLPVRGVVLARLHPVALSADARSTRGLRAVYRKRRQREIVLAGVALGSFPSRLRAVFLSAIWAAESSAPASRDEYLAAFCAGALRNRHSDLRRLPA